MLTRFKSPLFALALLVSGPALAGDCTGFVVGVRPISQYDHAAGRGFLAVRTGPSSSNRQIGELYAGDEVSVWDKSGAWYQIACMSGRCENPLWGKANPRGWVSARYISADGLCP
ncbi:MAG: SH3 domain-containing protein [Rhizobiaceae bacterium]